MSMHLLHLCVSPCPNGRSDPYSPALLLPFERDWALKPFALMAFPINGALNLNLQCHRTKHLAKSNPKLSLCSKIFL